MTKLVALGNVLGSDGSYGRGCCNKGSELYWLPGGGLIVEGATNPLPAYSPCFTAKSLVGPNWPMGGGAANGGFASRNAADGATREPRRLPTTKNITKPATSPRKTSPPTTPPAIAATLDFLFELLAVGDAGDSVPEVALVIGVMDPTVVEWITEVLVGEVAVGAFDSGAETSCWAA